MSGDVQARQRRKEKKKQKRDSVDQQALLKRLSCSEEDEVLPGVDPTKFNESEKKTLQMHVHESGHHGDHGAGMCAKIIFFSLMVILLGLVTLIVFENRGGSDVDTPLSESRFSEYLQGWVDENREDDHHEEPHFTSVEHDDEEHDHDQQEEDDHHEPSTIPDDEPYPEEKDVSNADENDDDDTQELNAEINNNESEQVDDNHEDEDDDQNNGDQDDDENDQNTQDDNDDQEQSPDNDNDDDEKNDEGAADDNNDEVPNLFEDSAPFDEEREHLKKQVDELVDTYNEIAEMLGKEKVQNNKDRLIKRETIKTKDDDDYDGVNDKENLENVFDNDAGEDLLLQKLAEESEQAQQQQSQENDGDENEEESSSLLVKLMVGALLALVAHQIIIKKISATNRIDSEIIEKSTEDVLLSKRRLTMLSSSEERLVNEEMDNEEIIEVMMIARPKTGSEEEEEYSDSELIDEEIEDEEEEELVDEEEEEEYSEEIADEYNADNHSTPYVPQTFEDFKNSYRPQQQQQQTETHVEKKVTFNEPQPVVEREEENEIEQRILNSAPSSSSAAVIDQKVEENLSPNKQQEQEEHCEEEEHLSYEPDIDIEDDYLGEEEQEEEEEEISGDDLIDDEELDYDESDEDISDIDDTELLKRLEAKYGRISDKDEDNDEASWTKLPETGGGAQSYMEELLRQQALEENPTIKELYEKSKSLDATAEREKSNKKLLEAIQSYRNLIELYGDKINDTIFKEVAERCIERMRFLGKLKQAVDIHYKLIHRFLDDPSYKNQLAVTYLLGNSLSAAKLVLHDVLTQWRYNGFALVHYGFVLKNLDKDYENAVIYLKEGIDTNEQGTQDGRFYFNLGDALQRLGRDDEAKKVYRKGAKIGLFLSEYQRSLYNVNRLRAQAFWTKVDTTYKDDLMEIHKYWQIIRNEGLKLLSHDGLFSNEQENLKDTGDWKQLELFARGAKTKYCQMAPITCKLIEKFKAAATCKRGQVKFSILHPNTHIHSHCGPTNCRIRAHLGLKVPEKTYLRVGDEIRSWKDGEWLIFDDSFEHEVWHNGTSLRLILIVDVWHPELTDDEKRSLSPI